MSTPVLCAVCRPLVSSVRCSQHATERGSEVALVIDRSHLAALQDFFLTDLEAMADSDDELDAVQALRAAVEAAS